VFASDNETEGADRSSLTIANGMCELTCVYSPFDQHALISEVAHDGLPSRSVARRWWWWRRDRRQCGRNVGPDQEHAAGRVVDDKPRRGPEAARSEPLAIAVARQHEDVHTFSGGHDLLFDAPAACLQPGWAPEARLSIGEQLIGCLLGDRPQRLRCRGWGLVSAQQAATGDPGDGFGLGTRHVQQRDLRVAGQDRRRLGDGGLPGVIDDPDERAHHNSDLQT